MAGKADCGREGLTVAGRDCVWQEGAVCGREGLCVSYRYDSITPHARNRSSFDFCLSDISLCEMTSMSRLSVSDSLVIHTHPAYYCSILPSIIM